MLLAPLFKNARIRPVLTSGILLCALFIQSARCEKTGTDLAITDLRCEYKTNPLGIDSEHPQLSWKLVANTSNLYQKVCQVLVASREELLTEDQADIWNSGRILSDDETSVIYKGMQLQSGQTYFWKARFYDQNDTESAWSAPAFWTMGLLNTRDWEAQWIGYDRARTDYTARRSETDDSLFLPPPRYLRREFTVSKPIKRATLYASALGLYEVRLNGQRVGDDFFTPGWTDYDKRVYYNTYNVTEMVHEGANAMGAILADGWYAGFVGIRGQRDHYGTQLRLRAQLVLEFDDGTAQTIATDDLWHASKGPLIESDFLMGETYDARREMPGWDQPGFNSTRWDTVDMQPEIDAIIGAYPSMPVKVFQEIKPLAITEPEAGSYVFDMGSNFAGIARLKIEATSGTVLTLKFGENLNPDGTVWTNNLKTARATDTYICKGGGVEIWQPQFTYHGFRYVGLTGYPQKPDNSTVTGIELTASTRVSGQFECSNPLLNQLYRNICQTQRANFMEVPTDCPQRNERLGWTGDAQAYIRTACYNMDVQAFFRKWFVDLLDAQFENGNMPRVAPSRPSPNSGGPAWADAAVICPWALYEMYGDLTVLERHYDSMVRFTDFRLNVAKKNQGYGDWLNIDAETPRNLIHAAYAAGDVQIMIQTAQALGNRQDASKYERILQNLKKDFQEEYVDKQGRVEGDTQTAYVLTLGFDLLEGSLKRKAERHLIEKIEERDWHLSTGFVGTRDLLHVLTKIGRTDVAYRLLLTETCPSWLYPVKNGATTIWEYWNAWTPEEGLLDVSFSHYTYGAVGQWMFENIGGIHSEKPGFKEILIQPLITTDLEWAKTSYESIHGLIRVEWKRDGTHVTLEVEIPPNTTAIVMVPGKGKTPKIGSGTYRFDGEI